MKLPATLKESNLASFPSSNRIDQVKPLHIVDFLEIISKKGLRLDGKEGNLYLGLLNIIIES